MFSILKIFFWKIYNLFLSNEDKKNGSSSYVVYILIERDP